LQFTTNRAELSPERREKREERREKRGLGIADWELTD
jgi:hypothetical protein